MPNYIKEIGIQKTVDGTPEMYHVNSDMAAFVNPDTTNVIVNTERKYTVAKYTKSNSGITVDIQKPLKNNQEVYVMLVNTSSTVTLKAEVSLPLTAPMNAYYTGISNTKEFSIEPNSTVEVSVICLTNGTTTDFFVRIA